MELDDRADVVGVVLAQVGVDVVVDLLELLADLLDLLGSEPVKRVLVVTVVVSWLRHRSTSTCPSGAFTQMRIISPCSPCTSPVRRSRSLPG